MTATSGPERPTGPTAGGTAPVGVFGGTFDPVHFGHLRSALEVREQLRLAAVHLIPAAQPPHRGAPGARPAERLAMLQLAAGGQPGFLVDDRELRRSGPSFTVDTLHSLRAELGTVPLCLILGMDAFRSLAGWHCWQVIPQLAHLVVTRRPGSPWPTSGPVAALLREHGSEDPNVLRRSPSGRVLLVSITQLGVSASAIRERVAAGLSARYLLPDAVDDYIHRHGLYRSRVEPQSAELP